MNTSNKFKHHPTSRIQVILNQSYNRWTLYRLRACYTDDLKTTDFEEASTYKDPSPHQLVWLWNLRRSVGKVIKNEGTLSRMTFMDLGAGSGVPVIYASKHFDFSRCIGVEMQTRLYRSALRNSELAGCSGESVFFILEDVSKLFLETQRHVLFCFNPFGVETMVAFLRNNAQVLDQTSSYLVLVNDWLLEIVLETLRAELIWRDPNRNCSVIRFGPRISCPR